MPILYLLIGPPGSGKTTAANIICQSSKAVHIWADRERQAMFNNPTHSKQESLQLYAFLNSKVERLLQEGKDVVFDTSFNFYKDRQHLREIAREAGAVVKIIHLTTDVNLAKVRATHGSHAEKNGMSFAMSEDTFERIAGHFEPLRPGEEAITINGRDIDRQELLRKLGLV